MCLRRMRDGWEGTTENRHRKEGYKYAHIQRDRQTDRGITGCGSYMISGAKSPVTMLVL